MLPVRNTRRLLHCIIVLVVGLHLVTLFCDDDVGIILYEDGQLRRVTEANTPQSEEDSSVVAISEISERNPIISLEPTELMHKIGTFFDRVEQIPNRYDGAVGDKNDANGNEKSVVYFVKPKIYTFFHRIDQDNRHTGMTNTGDDEMLALWQEEWTTAGFETRILSLEDAKSHTRFAEFEEKLDLVPMNTPTKMYNRMCFYRHLAMASVGGGYMSDYDVLPMIHKHRNKSDNNQEDDGFHFSRTELPVDFSNGEEIIIYNGFVPSLMSGSASKWEALAFELLENGVQHSDERMWTDMLAMLYLQISHQSLFKSISLVLDPTPLKKKWSERSCDASRFYIAVHFSHHGFRESKVDIDKRAQVARKWLKDWRSICLT